MTISKNINISRNIPREWIEIPASNKIVKNTVDIGGWALNDSGVKEIDILIDGKKAGQTTANIPRSDVNKAYPGYPGGNNSGFKCTLDLSTYAVGKHTMAIQAVGNDQSKLTINRSINISRNIPKGWIENPKPNMTIENSFNIIGWALNDSGVKEIDILIDGKKAGQTTANIPRSDVNKAYPGYPGGNNSGFKYQLDITTIKPGLHTITIQAIGKDGTSIRIGRNIIIKKDPPLMWIEHPTNQQYIKGDFTLSGWSLNDSGVKEIKIFVDNNYDGIAKRGIARGDVDNAFPGYLDGDKSGFSYLLNTEKYTNSTHVLKVISYGYDGTISQMAVKVNIINNTIVYSNYNLTLSNMVDIQYNVGAQTDIGGNGWVNATKEQIAQYVNPNNFMDDYGKLQFLKLNYTPGVTADDLNNILKNKGVLTGKGQQFLDAAWQYDVSPIYLVSHSLLETGNGTSELSKGILVSDINGQPVTPKIVYNMFGIGAYSDETGGVNKNGSEYAYTHGWFSVNDAIKGGIAFISQQYINNSNTVQNTLYKMRWNPDNPGTHEYASDIGWAYKQINRIKDLISQCKIIQLLFDIPRYLN